MRCPLTCIAGVLAGLSLAGVSHAEATEIPVTAISAAKVLTTDFAEVAAPAAKSQDDEPPADKARTTTQPKAQKANGPAVGFVPEPREQRSHHPRSLSDESRLFMDALKLQSSASEAASERLKQVLAINPSHAEARLLLGQLLTKSGEARKAIHVLTPLLDEQSPNWQAWFWAGSAMLLSGDLSGAGQALDQALLRERQSPEIWIQRAIVAQEVGDAESAMRLLNAAARLAPDDARVMLNIAVVANALPGMTEATEVYYERYRELEHQSRATQFELVSQVVSEAALEPAAPE